MAGSSRGCVAAIAAQYIGTKAARGTKYASEGVCGSSLQCLVHSGRLEASSSHGIEALVWAACATLAREPQACADIASWEKARTAMPAIAAIRRQRRFMTSV